MERVSEGSGVGVKGRIFIRIDKEQYAPGDLMTGTVFVTIAEPIQCKGIRCCQRLFCRGARFAFVLWRLTAFPNERGMCV